MTPDPGGRMFKLGNRQGGFERRMGRLARWGRGWSARGWGRRPWPGVFVLVALAAVTVLFTVQRDPAPTQLLLAAERYLNLAREASADQDAPETYELASKTLRGARSLMMSQFGRPAFLRDYGSTRAQILSAQRATAQALEEARQAVLQRSDRLQEEIRQVRNETLEVRSLLMNLPPRYHRALRFVVSAESHLLHAQRAHTPDETRDALSTVQTARGEVTVALQSVRGLMLRFLERRNEWDRDLAETLVWSRQSGRTAVVVDKLNHRVHLVRGGRSVRSYPAEFGPAWLDKKVVEGDRATPEGKYKIIKKRGRGQTRYHKALLLNYPNGEDTAAFQRLRRSGAVPHRARMGGLIEIHGDGGKGEDWTFGCVSLRNEHMDDVFRQLDIGSPVTIVGIWEEPSWLSRLLQTASAATEP